MDIEKRNVARLVLGLLCAAGRVPDLSDVDLRGANLRRADLRGANLKEANLRGADLREANLREANLSDANLSEADLSEANLSEANLRRADLSEADLSWADLNEAQGPNGLRASDLVRRLVYLDACSDAVVWAWGCDPHASWRSLWEAAHPSWKKWLAPSYERAVEILQKIELEP